MTLRAHLQQLFAHQRWADEQTFASLQQPETTDVVRNRFMHIVAAEHVWLQRLRGEPAKVAVWPEFTTDGCRQLMAQNHRAFDALLQAADDAALARLVPYQDSAGQSFRDSAADILLHVALHGSWHRGQIAVLLRQAGAQPAPTDYIAFVRGSPAARS
jgi:uncharacterized damage-inducible protein DinB